jgi:hypothetical protein
VSRDAYGRLDAALELLAPFGPELANGFTSHAPMVAEALSALGRPEAVLPWLERARPELTPRPAPVAPILPAAWRAALGRSERTADWMLLLRTELADAPWRSVLRRWLLRLMPGFCADALHGAIRVAHAVRALGVEETAPRRRELADALGAWAAGYQTLPVPAARSTGRHAPPAEALGRVPIQPAGERGFRGSIVSALAGLARFPAFEPVIDWIDPGDAPERAISSLTHAFASAYLANARDPLHAIVFVHGITSTAALRALVPHLAAGEARELIRYAWQAGAALQASFGREPAPPGAVEPPREDRETLIELALANGDDHAIKCTEACLAEHARRPSPVYLAAARHATSMLGPH